MPVSNPKRARLILHAQPIAAFGFEGGDALGQHFALQSQQVGLQLLVAGGPGGGHGGANTACTILLTRHARGKFTGSIARKHQVGV